MQEKPLISHRRYRQLKQDIAPSIQTSSSSSNEKSEHLPAIDEDAWSASSS
jgi:hypothetical protein